MPNTDDVVTWGDDQYGRVLHVMTEGTLDVPGGESVPASPESPAILVAVWEADGDEFIETDRVAGGPASDFTVVDMEEAGYGMGAGDDEDDEEDEDDDRQDRSASPVLQRRTADARWEVREESNGTTGLRGYAAVFDAPAHGEVVTRSAFDRSLSEEPVVELLFDHDGIPMASTRGGTMTLSADDTGLVVDVPALDMDSPYVRSIVSAMRRGDLQKMSFAFYTVQDSYDSSRSLRSLEDVELVDVSVVTRPWYDSTSVGLKSDPLVLVESRDSATSEQAAQAADLGTPTPPLTIGDLRMSNHDIVEPVEARSEDSAPADLEARVAAAEARADLEARIVNLEARAVATAESRAYDGVARVTREERTYSTTSDQRGVSFLHDVVARTFGDSDAGQRLSRHAQEERVERGSGAETRAIGTSALGAIVVPQYLVDLVAPVARAGRPTADICNRMPLPAEGMTVEIPRITTGTSAATQATQNTSVSETNLDETTLSVPVVTIAGQQTISVQALSRGRGTEQIIIRDLVSAYNTNLDAQIINGAAGTGEHRGILNVSGIQAVTYTDSTPTVAELYPKLFDLIQKVQTNYFGGISHFLMHPRRWSYMAAAVGTSQPFLQINQNPQGAGGQFGAPSYGGIVGNIAGVDVVLDANIATTTATNQDTIYGVTASELHLWEDGGAPLFIRVDQASSLGVTIAAFGFTAFTAGRYPAAHGKISGTGLTTPTF
jgi:HK97 family phage prohead protease/HK97 family phage major capsid protein